MTERIDIVITERGSRTVRRSLDNIGVSASGAQGAVSLLRRALGLLGGAAVATGILRTADTFAALQNQLRVVTGSAQALATANQRLFDISQRTGTGFEDNIRLFQRLSIATDELGASEDQLFTFTERVGQALTVFGISSQQARGALLQLSQGLQSGVFRAEEFNSILEGAFPIAQAAARGFTETGISVGDLRRRVLEGQVTSDQFFQAFLRGSEEIADQFARTAPTIARGLTVLNNSFTRFVGELAGTVNLSAVLGRALIALGDNLEVVAKGIAVLVGAAGFPLLLFLIRSTIVGFVRLGAVILANPLLALGTVLSGLIVATNLFQDELKETRAFLVNLGEGALEVLTNVIALVLRAARNTSLAFRGIGLTLEGVYTVISNRVLEFFENTINGIIQAANRVGRSLPSFAQFEFAEVQLGRVGRSASEIAAELRTVSQELATSETTARALAEAIVARGVTSVKELTNTVRTFVGELVKAGEVPPFGEEVAEQAKVATVGLEDFTKRLNELRNRRDAFSGIERGILNAAVSINDFASTVDSAITGAFQRAQDVVVDFVSTGKFEFQDFLSFIREQFIRLGVQQLFAAAFGGGTGLGGLFGNALGLSGGGGGGFGAVFSGIGSLFGFQNGVQGASANSLAVSRLPGVDNRLVAFRARSDETIDVNRRGECGGRSVMINNTFNFGQGASVDEFRRSETQIRARMEAAARAAARSVG